MQNSGFLITQAAANLVPDAHIPGKRNAPIMFTTDIALKEDPEFRKIVERFRSDPAQFDLAFAKAWFKLTHRDMGPRARYVGADVPSEVLLWQDPLPKAEGKTINSKDVAKLKKQILKTGLTTSELVRTAWASAASHRVTDMRGGANGARIRLEPQASWAVNNPKELNKVLTKLEGVQKAFNKKSRRDVSLADVIVLAGAAGIEQAAKDAGMKVSVPFAPGRVDASQEQTEVLSFSYLEPKADAFRNYFTKASYTGPSEMMVDKANMLGLTVPEMTVLVGGLRSININYDGNTHGVFTDKPGTLNNDFFTKLLDIRYTWSKTDQEGIYQGKERATGKAMWTATPVDLIFGSNSELRAVAEVYASEDAKQKFYDDFINAWVKVMQLDRFDLK